MRTHILQCVTLFGVVTTVLLYLILKLDFNEDISAFLPFGGRQHESFQVYQDVSGANKLITIFQHTDSLDSEPDKLIAAVDEFSRLLIENDSLHLVTDFVTNIDLDAITGITDFVYGNIPYFFSEADYVRMDSLLSQKDYVKRCLEENKRMLIFPMTNLLVSNMAKDPLNLFSPIVSKLSHKDNSAFFESYDGYIFTKDMQKCLTIMSSPFGNSETQKNAEFMSLLDKIATDIEQESPSVDINFIGGPSIAVGNASQIKQDSLLSVAISVVLILLLMLVVFKSMRDILLIVLSITWGWVFALGLLSLFHEEVSLIVIGISSIILGIAVNYPLHLIIHLRYTSGVRQTLREVVSPLIIGNVTTVGAFMALFPLNSVALRDLGLFSAFLLVGTILYVVIFLPHALKTKMDSVANKERKHDWLTKLGSVTLENSRCGIFIVIVGTCLFAYYSPQTQFDSNMSHINYMTDEQHDDMEYFQQMTSGIGSEQRCVYVVSKGQTIDDALTNAFQMHKELGRIAKAYDGTVLSSCSDFFIPQSVQADRIERWNTLVDKYRDVLTDGLLSSAKEAGFSTDAFEPFFSIIGNSYAPKSFEYFSPLRILRSANISFDKESGSYRIVDVLKVKNEYFQEVKEQIAGLEDAVHFCFDVSSMNSAFTTNLSENFNYIGWTCGIIVFVFLWFSFGSLELALISFLPMAVSWIWILGIMGLTGIQFNIVNIILATFIFGQGDDYTIFMTEGCCYEYAYHRKMLVSYKGSIILSALIMFIGIGTLILAEHPALRSLAEVTIVGMFSVVLMAYLLPPLTFKWIVSNRGQYRKRPLTVIPLLRTVFCGSIWMVQLIIGYMLGAVLLILGQGIKKKRTIFRKFVTLCHKLDVILMPGLRFTLHNPMNEDFSKPCVIVCNHQSILDSMYLMAMNHKIIIVANKRSSMNLVVQIMFKWLGFYTIRNNNFIAWKDSSLERDLDVFKGYVNDGYSIAFFPEGVHNSDSSIVRYHKGPFYLAEELDIDIVPVIIHGVNYIMPKRSFACYAGNINMHIGGRINSKHHLWGRHYSETTKLVHKYCMEEYGRLRQEYETTSFFYTLLLDRYRYKGSDVMMTIKSDLKKFGNYSQYIDKRILEETVLIKHSGYGEMALLFALVHPDKNIIAYEEDAEKCELAKYAAEGVVENISFVTGGEHMIKETDKMIIYDRNTL